MRLALALVLVLPACATEPAATRGEADTSTTAAASSLGATSTDSEVPTTTDEPATSTVPTTTSTTGDETTGDETTTTTEATTGDVELSEDEALLRRAIAGEVDAAQALATISDRGGLPVLTIDGAYLFACLCGPGDWQLAGAHNQWTDAPMATAGPLWWAEAEVPAAEGSLYKFHDLAAEAWIADPLGRRYGHDDNGRYSLVRASEAHLERWYAVTGAGLPPRDLQVWVPAGGAFTHALYVHDGQNLFDPEAPFGYWKLQESAPPDMLLVGIDNTAARIDEYTHVVDDIGDGEIGGDGLAYAELVDTIIRPRMEAAYGEPARVATMGSSLGGLISLVIADLYPDRYDMALSLSGTVGWGSIGLHNETIIERYAAAGKRDFAIYLDAGGDGPCSDSDMDGVEDDSPAADNYCENTQLYGALQDLGWSDDVDLWYVHAPGAMHNEAAWSLRVGGAMNDFAGL